ncbi:MAG: hypothetical protein AAB358_01925 [Patescibacteria group bacterium]
MKKSLLALAVVAAFVLAGCSLIPTGNQNQPSNENQNANTNQESAPAVNFTKTGNISNWANKTFLYEEPGKPAVSATLSFGDYSQCDNNAQGFTPCNVAEFKDGDRVLVEGNLADGVVKVVRITFVKDTGATDPTAGWSTYSNSQYGFEFKYPKGYIVFNNSLYTSEAYANKDKKGCDTCKWVGIINIISVKTSDTIDQYVIREFAWPGKTLEEAKKTINSENSSYQKITIGNNDFIKAWSADMNLETIYLLKHDGNIIGLKVVGDEGEILKQILSTFKFNN